MCERATGKTHMGGIKRLTRGFGLHTMGLMAVNLFKYLSGTNQRFDLTMQTL